MKYYKALLLSVLALSLTACSSRYDISKDERTVAYSQFVESENLAKVEAIEKFKILGWDNLDENFLIVNTFPVKSYLVKFRNECDGLDFANRLKINKFNGSKLIAKTDSVSLIDKNNQKCSFNSIYEISNEQRKELIAIGRPSH